jgi:hypothetical protein
MRARFGRGEPDPSASGANLDREDQIQQAIDLLKWLGLIDAETLTEAKIVGLGEPFISDKYALLDLFFIVHNEVKQRLGEAAEMEFQNLAEQATAIPDFYQHLLETSTPLALHTVGETLELGNEEWADLYTWSHNERNTRRLRLYAWALRQKFMAADEVRKEKSFAEVFKEERTSKHHEDLPPLDIEEKIVRTKLWVTEKRHNLLNDPIGDSLIDIREREIKLRNINLGYQVFEIISPKF